MGYENERGITREIVNRALIEMNGGKLPVVVGVRAEMLEKGCVTA